MKDKVIIVEMLVEKIEQYAKTSLELYKLKAIDKGTDVFSSLISRVVIITIIALFFLLVTLGLCFYLGEVLGKVYYGFFAVAGIYAVVGIIMIIFRKRWLDDTLNDYIVRQIFKEKKR
ncbi:hypothetical protein FNO01nite_29930 [Flavobacterium noncentrifugens]|uniref:Holin-X, holin superfamily III n=1 Tax=Flavobacterium noncentrifugens TaxID=1128970 RepID=A0A1G9BP72_9FLAO|nr:hypothetical protein [Flavobacterium noncentrifugens]GEP52321.1 hypothetical protein FNO01nite_29930 [Flavobacterium noncentrifugens]SDK41257.1 hypothetical protein SAMN04487935_3303 [Flavobacterium noncentrifugens]